MKPNRYLKQGVVLRKRYKIRSLLAKSKNGSSYLAFDNRRQKQVVLKILALSGIDDVTLLEKFAHEAKVLRNLDHPAIPDYYDHFILKTKSDEYHVIIQEYVAADCLFRQIAAGRRFSLPEVYQMVNSLLEILVYIHNLQPPLIHRDIRPHNILIDRESKVWLADFKTSGKLALENWRGESSVGPVGWLPPEQIVGKTIPASDIYALGTTVIYVLTGREPADLYRPDQKPNYRPYCHAPTKFLKIIDKMVEPKLAKRFADAKDALKSLQIFLRKAKTEEKAKQLSSHRSTAIQSAKSAWFGLLAQVFQNISSSLPRKYLIGLFFLSVIFAMIIFSTLRFSTVYDPQQRMEEQMQKEAAQAAKEYKKKEIEKKKRLEKEAQNRVLAMQNRYPEAAHEVEPNNSFENALTIPEHGMVGFLKETKDEDFFHIDIPGGQNAEISLACMPESETRIYLTVYDEKFKNKFGRIRVVPGAEEKTQILTDITEGGRFYIKMNGIRKDGSYRIRAGQSPQNDAGLMTDAGYGVEDALRIAPDTQYHGMIGIFDHSDWYELCSLKGKVLHFKADSEGGKRNRLTFTFYTPDGDSVWSEKIAVPFGASVEIPMGVSAEEPGYMAVGYSGKEAVSYKMIYSMIDQQDSILGGDAGDAKNQGRTLRVGKPVNGQIGGMDKTDWYQFFPVIGERLEFEVLESGEHMLDVSISDSGGNSVWRARRVKPGQVKYYQFKRIQKPKHIKASDVIYTVKIACRPIRKKHCPCAVMPYRLSLFSSSGS